MLLYDGSVENTCMITEYINRKWTSMKGCFITSFIHIKENKNSQQFYFVISLYSLYKKLLFITLSQPLNIHIMYIDTCNKGRLITINYQVIIISNNANNL